MTDRILEKLLEMLQFGLLASLGGLANYLYVTVMQEKKFSVWMMLVNLFLAFYVGNVAGSFMSDDSSYRDGVLMAAGFLTYPLLAVAESQSKRLITTVLERWTGTLFGGSTKRSDKPEE